MSTSKDVVASALELGAKKDAEGMAALMADDIVIHCPGRTALAGDHRGRQGFFGFFGRLQELSGGTLTPQVHEILGEGEHAVALIRLSAERGGRKADWNQANVYHVQGGKITEVWIFPEDLYRFDEFWG